MPVVPLKSSNLRAVSYDEDERTLTVYFVNGNSYEYADVPKSVYDALINASSAGRYFNRFIKGVYG